MKNEIPHHKNNYIITFSLFSILKKGTCYKNKCHVTNIAHGQIFLTCQKKKYIFLHVCDYCI